MTKKTAKKSTSKENEAKVTVASKTKKAGAKAKAAPNNIHNNKHTQDELIYFYVSYCNIKNE